MKPSFFKELDRIATAADMRAEASAFFEKQAKKSRRRSAEPEWQEQAKEIAEIGKKYKIPQLLKRLRRGKTSPVPITKTASASVEDVLRSFFSLN